MKFLNLVIVVISSCLLSWIVDDNVHKDHVKGDGIHNIFIMLLRFPTSTPSFALGLIMIPIPLGSNCFLRFISNFNYGG